MSKTKRNPEANGKPAKPNPDANPVRDKFRSARDAMNKALIQREEEIDLALTAMLSGEHLILVGPPGCGKSLLLDGLVDWCHGSSFSILLNKFTNPEEVFGPLSVKALENDQYRRVTTGMLPEADLCFIDEVFKGSSAILNTMLRILNEREFGNGDGTFRKCPLLFALAASNEWPGEDGKELGALFDRFLFRKSVKPIRGDKDRFRLLFEAKDHKPKFSSNVTMEEIKQARKECDRLDWEDAAKEGFISILRELNGEGIFPGDRRIFKSRQAVRSWAWLDGSDIVLREHLTVLQHTLWDDPSEQPEKCAKIVRRIASPTLYKIADLVSQAKDVAVKCQPIEAVPKLQEISRQIAAMGTDPKVIEAEEFVDDMIVEIHEKVVKGHKNPSWTARIDQQLNKMQMAGRQSIFMKKNNIPATGMSQPPADLPDASDGIFDRT